MSDLAERYGGPRPTRRRITIAASAALAVVFLGWLAWVMLDQGDPAVTSDIVSFDVVDQHTSTATFTVVRRTVDVEASCLLRAQAPDHSVVGELNLTVGPGGPERATLTEAIRTEREATSVSVVGCRAEGQTQRR